ncbi:MAG: PKD repeat protein [Sphingobacteriales bacterium]|jgi:PKD repeat protein
MNPLYLLLFSFCFFQTHSLVAHAQNNSCGFGRMEVVGPNEACLNDGVDLIVDADSTNFNYRWFSDSTALDTISDSTSAYIQVISDTTIYLKAYKNDSCESTFITWKIKCEKEKPTACFSYCAEGDLTYQFYDLSQTATSWRWEFGRIGTGFKIKNPFLTFSQEGFWTIYSYVSNICGSDIFETEIFVYEDSIGLCDTPKTFLSNKEKEYGIYPIIQLFPNPSTSIVSINVSDARDAERLELYNATGQKVYSEKLVNNNSQLMVDQYPNGMYQLKIFSSDNSLIGRGKIVVAK